MCGCGYLWVLYCVGVCIWGFYILCLFVWVLYCVDVCMFGFCIVWVCVRVGFVLCGCVNVLVCNVWVCVCVCLCVSMFGIAKFWCSYEWVCDFLGMCMRELVLCGFVYAGVFVCVGLYCLCVCVYVWVFCKMWVCECVGLVMFGCACVWCL